MKNLCKSVLGLGVIGMCLGLISSAHAASGVGPYYATPSWDQTLPGSTRFIELTNMTGAVLDRETGLVWEKSPRTDGMEWGDASQICLQKSVGGRLGWRLPTIQDLTSLVDRTSVNPALSSGHPFTVQSSLYWSATTNAFDSTNAYLVSFSTGSVDSRAKFAGFLAWCVRGGQGLDTQ